MAAGDYQQLTQDDVDHFLEHGWLKLENCFTQEQSGALTKDVWTRLGVSPDDKSTWTTEIVHMARRHEFYTADFAPKAWRAICDLLGGKDRIAAANEPWGDNLIVNLGTCEDLTGWHVDGDYFVHYLDSPEQGLLAMPLFTDIQPGGGGTLLFPAAISKIAKQLRDHPEGVSQQFAPRAENPTFEFNPAWSHGLRWFCNLVKDLPDDAFVEATGKIGDIYLLHPLLLHTATHNKLRALRIVTNPGVNAAMPFNYTRADKESYSLVERKTLDALGVERLEGWKITQPREQIIPARLREPSAVEEDETRRLKELKPLDSLMKSAPMVQGKT